VRPTDTFPTALNSYLQGGPKSKPLPNEQKIVLKHVSEIKFIRQIKNESSTIILFVGITYSMRYLLSDLNNYA